MSHTRDDDLEAEALAHDAFLGPEEADTPTIRRKAPPALLPGHFVRVPVEWFINPRKPSPFGEAGRLWLWILYRSHWGKYGLRLTDAATEEIGLKGTSRRRVLAQLERNGWLRLERRSPNAAPIAWPRILVSGEAAKPRVRRVERE